MSPECPRMFSSRYLGDSLYSRVRAWVCNRFSDFIPLIFNNFHYSNLRARGSRSTPLRGGLLLLVRDEMCPVLKRWAQDWEGEGTNLQQLRRRGMLLSSARCLWFRRSLRLSFFLSVRYAVSFVRFRRWEEKRLSLTTMKDRRKPEIVSSDEVI